VVGVDPGEPPAGYPLVVVAVRCDLHERPLEPLLEARAELARWLGSPEPLDEPTRRAPQPSPRSHLLGRQTDGANGDWLLDSFRRLGTDANDGVALLFEAVERADPASLELLRRAALRRGWLRIPLILWFESDPREGAAAELLRAVRETEGEGGVVRSDGSERSERPARADAPVPEVLPALRADSVRALRAAAMIGSAFESSLVASLLGVDPLAALELFQEARDAGVPLDDRGDGRFRWPRAWVDELKREVLPSLAAAWHDRLAELIDAATVASRDPESTRVVPPPGFVPRGAPAAPVTAPVEPPADESARSPAPDLPPRSSRRTPPPVATPPASGSLVPIEAAPPTEAQMLSDDQALAAFTGSPARPARGSALDARAARHLAEAGKPDAAVERYLIASEEAAARGSNRLAIDHGREALAILARLPATARRRLLRIQVLARLGRLQWEAAGPGSDFTLTGALKVLEEAQQLVRPEDPVPIGAGLRALVASVCYDLGDGPSLERALEELTRASKDLHASGDALGAARLFNDQAAVWVRLGDPVRANHLLTESRAVFERLAADDEAARIELAETDHLIARLPLHVRSRPGRESDAIEMGLQHAREAERRYRELDAMREAGRVWETMGRLELRRGHSDAAAEHLTQAVELQSKLGDVLGLARSSGALAEVLAASGRVEDALAILGDSIELNLQKGSPLGLAYNRRAFERFHAALEPGARNALAQTLERVDAQLGEAEAVLGRVSLPERNE